MRTLAIHSRASGSSRYARPKSAVSSAWRRARCFGEFNRGRVILFLTALLQVTCAGSGRIDVSRSRSCMRGRQVQAGRQTRGPPTGILANAGSKGVLSLSRAPLSTENPGDSVARGAHSDRREPDVLEGRLCDYHCRHRRVLNGAARDVDSNCCTSGNLVVDL